MSFDIRNIPSTIQGVVPQPVRYGKSTHEQYTGYSNAAQQHFFNTGDTAPLERVAQAGIRYTPEGTISKGAVTEEAIGNALGYAAADIAQFDTNDDRALNRQEVLQAFLTPRMALFSILEESLRNTETPESQKAQIQTVIDQIVEETAVEAGNYIASIDTPDANGQRDGLITADEAAAKLLFDDTAKQMFEDNREAYKIIIDGLQAKTDYGGPSFEELQQSLDEIVGTTSGSPFRMDGQLTAGEREIAHVLTTAPIPTNEIISQIHKTLNLKEHLQQTNPFAS